MMRTALLILLAALASGAAAQTPEADSLDLTVYPTTLGRLDAPRELGERYLACLAARGAQADALDLAEISLASGDSALAAQRLSAEMTTEALARTQRAYRLTLSRVDACSAQLDVTDTALDAALEENASLRTSRNRWRTGAEVTGVLALLSILALAL